jgi:hypothetical protein
MDKTIISKIFENFVLLDSGIELLHEYLNGIEEQINEKYKRLILIKKLAEKELVSKILDDISLPSLIKEANKVYPLKKNKVQQNKNSFKDLLYDEDAIEDQKFILNNFIYNSSIIYVDSIKDFPSACETILKSSKYTEQNTKTIFSNPVEKPKIFLNRLQMIKNFLFQSGEFKTKFQKNSDGLQINSLDCLLGNSEDLMVIGMLIVNEEGKLQLQDERKIINIYIDETQSGKGYFTPGCIVLAQGVLKNEIFKVKAMIHPTSIENKMTFREMYENDYFGAITKAFKSNSNSNNPNFKFNNLKGRQINNTLPEANFNVKPEENYLFNFIKSNSDLTNVRYFYPKNSENYILANYENLKKTSSSSNSLVDKILNATQEFLADEFLLIISNPDLTNENILSAIEKVIQGYSSATNTESSTVPFMIIFIGNFVSENSFNSFKALTTAFENLANILAKNHYIMKNTYITFISGPEDFSLFSGFPKFPINEIFVNILKKKNLNVIPATNPCRFSIFGKEFVFFRDNINKNLARNQIFSSDPEKNREYYIHTILSQGYLSPLDLNTTARIWHMAHSLSITPQPDYLILADIVLDFVSNSGKTTVLNPGSFSKDFTFYIVYPIRNVVEPCRVNQ